MRYLAVSPLAFAFGLLTNAPAIAQEFDHSALDTVLARYVRDGRVDYAALKVEPEILHRYVRQVAAVTAEEFSGWSEATQIAYLVNAYNAYILVTVVDRYPIKGSSFLKKLTAPKRFSFPANSIRHIDGVFDGLTHEVAGQELTLDGIEHGMLRAEYNEPRIHFALVCAAVSCPPLREEAYRGNRLDEQLDEQARAFLSDPRLNRFELERGRVYLSKIFDWFGADFQQFATEAGYAGDRQVNGVLNFAARYLPQRVTDFLEGGAYQVHFESYDWTLNDQAIAAGAR
ncbi:MAG: DUF547 domain-containing protein [Gemmatimonadota bacterium]|nr:MAG: DUF547 domain-containing protein [Gemmatimonadota bacterium]